MFEKLGEIVTANEALRRVGCDELCATRWETVLVEWVGHPKAFSCGHTLPEGRDAQGYVQTERRVNQHWCSGAVLYSWSLISTSTRCEPFRLRGGFRVAVDTRDRNTFLDAAIYG